MRALILDREEQASQLSTMLERVGFEVAEVHKIADALSTLSDLDRADALIGSSSLSVDVAVCSLGRDDSEACWPLLAALRSQRRDGAASHVAFPIVLSHTAASDVRLRLQLFAAGARMVTSDLAAVEVAARRIADTVSSQGTHACPVCRRGGFTAAALSVHVAMTHGSEPNMAVRACPVCSAPLSREPLVVHLNHKHGPAELREPAPPAFAAFAWVVCRREADGKFLLVNEPAGLCRSSTPGYWLPAGRLDSSEGLEEAAVRECLEEAGVHVVVTGVLQFNFRQGGVPRIVLMARPADAAATEPKSVPVFESVGALWVAASELDALGEDDYRSPDPAYFFPRVASGELRAQTLETEAWRNFDAPVRRLTAAEGGARAGDDAELRTAWEALARTYPTAILRE